MSAIKGNKDGMLPDAIAALSDTCDKMDDAYGPCAADREIMDAVAGKGSLKTLLEFVIG